jgi:hypothetical protein
LSFMLHLARNTAPPRRSFRASHAVQQEVCQCVIVGA